MMKHIFVLLAAATLVCLGPDSHADNLLINGSFEEGEYLGGAYNRLSPGSTSLTGWTIGGEGVDWHNQEHFGPAYDGDKMIDLHLDGETYGSISQSFPTVVGETYLLEFALSGPGLGSSFLDPRFVNVDVAGVVRQFSQAASSPAELDWSVHRLVFQAVETTTSLTFSNDLVLGHWGPVVDDVSVEGVVPVSKVLQGVPVYGQQANPWNCGPTAAGMIMGYWDDTYDSLVLGEADTQTAEVDTMISEIGQRALTTPLGTSQPLLGAAMYGYAMSKGVLSASAWNYGINRVDDYIRSSIEHDCPLLMYTTNHYVVIDGYQGVINPTTGIFTLDDVHIVDPAADGTKKWNVDGGEGDNYPIHDVLSFLPLMHGLNIAFNAVQGGGFDSEESLELFSVEGDDAGNGVDVVVLPGTTDRQVLAMTSVSGDQISVTQEAPYAAGDGFQLTFDYVLPPDSELTVLFEGNELATLTDCTSGVSSFEMSVDTQSMGLEHLQSYPLTFCFSGTAGSVLYLDDVLAVVQPQALDGDLNGDGFVGGDDLDLIRGFWGQNVTAGDLLSGDPSGDGFVGGDDLDIVRGNWGRGIPPTAGAVPESSALLLLALGSLTLVCIRRREGVDGVKD